MIYTVTLNPSVDQYIAVNRLTPNDKNKAENMYLEPGGKGFNVARVIQELGGKTRAFGFAGGHTGEILRTLLLKNQVKHTFFSIQGEIRTNFVIRDQSTKTQTRINSPGPKVSQKELDHLLEKLNSLKVRPKFWVLCGSLPPGIPENIYQRLILHFQKQNERCVLDSDEKALRLGLKAKPFMIKPNIFELERLMGRACQSRDEIRKAGRQLTSSAQVVVITLAEQGAYIFTHNDEWHLVPPKVNVRSDVGAGDAFIGGFLTALDRGESLREASRWAVAAATSSVSNEGTANCCCSDVKRLMKCVTVKKIE